MDRNTVTGLILILIVMVAWAYFTMPTEQELKERQAEQARQDSIAAVQADSQQAARQSADSAQSQAPSSKETQLSEDKEDTPSEMGIFSTSSAADTS